jgi:hypothetical protein
LSHTPITSFLNACFWFVTYSHHLFPQCMLLVCCILHHLFSQCLLLVCYILPSPLSSTPTCSSPTYSSFAYVTCSLNLLMLPTCCLLPTYVTCSSMGIWIFHFPLIFA